MSQLTFATMVRRPLRAPGFAAAAALLTAAALILSSCSDSRPTVEEWQPTWEMVVGAIPSESVIGESPPRAICNETLGFLRSNRGSLFPTPDLAIDDAVGDWISIAEDAFFECPPNNEHVRGFSEMYQLLHRLQGEVELVLDMDRAP